MKIVVLDGYSLNPGDLSWDELRTLGDVEVFDRTPEDEVIKRAGNAEIVLINKIRLGEAELIQLPKLRYIGVLATGYDVVDTKAARKRGIIVTNVPAYSTASVAQHTFALILEFFNYPGKLSDEVRKGSWSSNPDFSYWHKPLIELEGKITGIVGFGKIGRAVASVAEAFNMKVIVNELTEVPGYENCSLEKLLETSDIVSLHCPLTFETRGIINRERLALMKPSSLLVNCARGALIVEQDLADALNSGRIAGAALDVLTEEPPRPDNPLLTAKNCIITPHVAWATYEARKRLMKVAVDNVRSFLKGEIVNCVSF